jgi:DNA-binding MarR family transcriptional regulator
MHESNLWAAWTLRSHDVLTAALPDGLGLRDAAALTLVESHPDCSVDWLLARIGLTQSGTVRLIDRLESLGYLTRARAGRAVRLNLLPAGMDVLRQWNEAREAAGDEVLGGLSPQQRTDLNLLLGQALRRTERLRVDADTTCRLCDWTACTECPVSESVEQE